MVNIPFVHAASSSYEEHTSRLSPKRELKRQGKTTSMDSNSTDTSEGSIQDGYFPLKVRGGALRRPAGYQVCSFPLVSR